MQAWAPRFGGSAAIVPRGDAVIPPCRTKATVPAGGRILLRLDSLRTTGSDVDFTAGCHGLSSPIGRPASVGMRDVNRRRRTGASRSAAPRSWRHP